MSGIIGNVRGYYNYWRKWLYTGTISQQWYLECKSVKDANKVASSHLLLVQTVKPVTQCHIFETDCPFLPQTTFLNCLNWRENIIFYPLVGLILIGHTRLFVLL
jgi:hypothetical protein